MGAQGTRQAARGRAPRLEQPAARVEPHPGACDAGPPEPWTCPSNRRVAERNALLGAKGPSSRHGRGRRSGGMATGASVCAGNGSGPMKVRSCHSCRAGVRHWWNSILLRRRMLCALDTRCHTALGKRRHRGQLAPHCGGTAAQKSQPTMLLGILPQMGLTRQPHVQYGGEGQVQHCREVAVDLQQRLCCSYSMCEGLAAYKLNLDCEASTKVAAGSCRPSSCMGILPSAVLEVLDNV